MAVKLRMKPMNGEKDNIRARQAIWRTGQRESGRNVYSGLMINGYNYVLVGNYHNVKYKVILRREINAVLHK